MSDVPVSREALSEKERAERNSLKEGDVVYLLHCPSVLMTVTCISASGEVSALGYDKQGCPFTVRVRAPALGTYIEKKTGGGK